MDFIKYIRVGAKRAETGIGAEQDLSPAILSTWKICRVGIEKYPPAEGDKLTGAGFLLR